ncbi:MAG TPA: Gldg family protein [Planctomycetota bacterium]|nr:Gldg family protein [Planctomycetota bacterium]HRR82747.1 Gldg family protein [Planctomycetota bacterium]HRT93582.1 Gldg family protein [Planctomycetota bacterium]
MAKDTATASRGGSPSVFLYPVIGLLAVGNVVFALLWLLNPIASGPSGERSGRRVEVHTGRRVLRVGEGVSAGEPNAGFESRLPGEEFEELTKRLSRLAQVSRGEQADEFFRSDAGKAAKPALVLTFPRRGVGTERLEVYAADTRRKACYCRLGSTGEALAVNLDEYQKIAAELSALAGGAAGGLTPPYFMPIGEPLRAKLAKLEAPLGVTTVSSDPRQYLLQMLSNPLLGGAGLQMQQPDAGTVLLALRLPDDQAMTRALAEAMARASDKVKAQHFDFATQAEAVREFARSLQRPVSEVEDALVLQYAGRVRILRGAELLGRDDTAGPLVAPVARFEGEKVLVQALDGLLTDRGLLYFAEGHGERRIADRRNEGLNQVVEQLNSSGFRTGPLDLSSAKAVPADCQVLVLAGPKKPYPAELEKALAAYLDGGGRLALMLDPPDGAVPLADVLKRFGVTVPDPKKVLEVPGRLTPPVAIEMELNTKLDFAQRWTREPLVCYTATELAVTPPAEDASFEVFRLARPAESGEGAKPPCLIAAIRPKAGAKGPKLLVFSDVDAFSNQLVRQVAGNVELLTSALTWLAE